MLLYWALVVGLCQCSFSEPTWFYQSTNSEDGWSVENVFPGLYTTDKDGRSTLSIPPHALEMTLAYYPVDSVQECCQSLLYNDMASYFTYEGADFNLSPDKNYQVKWSDVPLSKSVSRKKSVETLQTAAQNPMDDIVEIPGVSLLFNPMEIALTPIESPSDVKQMENNPSATLSKGPSVQLNQDSSRIQKHLQNVRTFFLPSAGLAPRKTITPPSIKDTEAIQSPPLTPVKRAVWFKGNTIQQFSSQCALKKAGPLILFSKRYIYGVTVPYKQTTYQEGINQFMGYRINYNRIIFLDGYSINGKVKTQPIYDPRQPKPTLSLTTLKAENFKKAYPLETDGLVVSLYAGHRENYRLFMASYGEPPLGAILLRPRGNWLAVVARTFDDTVKSVKVHDGDIVVVGPLLGISNLERGLLSLNTSSTSNMIAKSVYSFATEASLCVVATISTKR